MLKFKVKSKVKNKITIEDLYNATHNQDGLNAVATKLETYNNLADVKDVLSDTKK